MNSRPVIDWMESNEVTRQAMAGMLGVNLSTLWRYLSTKREVPRTALLAISAVTGIPVEELGGRPIRERHCKHCGSVLEAENAAKRTA